MFYKNNIQRSSRSLGVSGRINAGGGGGLSTRRLPRPNAYAAEEKDQEDQAGGQGDLVGGVNDYFVDDDSKSPLAQSRRTSNGGYDEPIMLTQSTHSFLFTEPTRSLPFVFAILVVIISYVCLLLALFNNLYQDWSPDNPFNVPVGVTLDVKIAQYLALLIGLIMEEEIPESLYLLRTISKKTLGSKVIGRAKPNVIFGKFIFCALVRIVMGYVSIVCDWILLCKIIGSSVHSNDLNPHIFLHVPSPALLPKHVRRCGTSKGGHRNLLRRPCTPIPPTGR